MTELKELDYLTEIADFILSEAKTAGVENAEVLVNSGENIATRFGENHITQNTLRKTLTFNLRSQIGSKVGMYNGTMSSKNGLKSMVNNAIDLVKYSVPDPEFPGFTEVQPKYANINRKIVETSPEEIADIIGTIVDVALNTDSKISAVAGNINYTAGRAIFKNTFHVEGNFEQSKFTGNISIAATVGENESRSSCTLAGLQVKELEPETAASDVSERAVRGLDQGSIEPGKYQAVLSHEAIMEFMAYLGFATSSNMLINYQSPFKDKLGEKVFDERFTITDTTEDPTHISSQPFDSEGTPAKSIKYIDQGVIKDFAYDLRNAKKLGVTSNGRGTGGFAIFRAPTISAGSRSVDEIIGGIDDGVYISGIWYANFVNMPEGSITGLTRDGLFRIKNGEIDGSLKNMRFTDTLFSMFKGLEPANDQKQKNHGTYGNMWGLGGKLPTVALDELNFTSGSKH